MKLTGKCLDAFGDKYFEFEHLPESCQNALIIEFFDSVGIYISLEWKYKYFEIGIIGMKNNITISLLENDNRLKATNAAIIKANDLYNEKC